MAYAWLYIVTNKPNGILYLGVTGDIQPRAWKIRLILAQNPDWTDLYDTLV
jgi:predicted GIY-YIG superfamily endonuclease